MLTNLSVKWKRVNSCLCKLVCHHGCFEIQSNEQDHKFRNLVSTELLALTGIEQRITSTHNTWSNKLVERETLNKKTLVKGLDENTCNWPKIIENVLFALWVSKRSSMSCFPFFLLYNRDQILPKDVRHSSSKWK